MKKKHGQRRDTDQKDAEIAVEAAPSNGAIHTNGHVAGDLWQAVLADLREQMVPTNYQRWLARTELRQCSGGEAVVGVPDQVSAEQLARRFDFHIRRALADACGQAVTVRYEVANEA